MSPSDEFTVMSVLSAAIRQYRDQVFVRDFAVKSVDEADAFNTAKSQIIYNSKTKIYNENFTVSKLLCSAAAIVC